MKPKMDKPIDKKDFTKEEIDLMIMDYKNFLSVDKIYRKTIGGDIKFIEQLIKVENIRKSILEKLLKYL